MILQGQVKVKKSLEGNLNERSNLDGLVNVAPSRTGVVDNLETADPKKALSANQGVVLKGMVDSLEEAVQGIIDDLNYKAIDITALSNTAAGTHELGKVITGYTLAWSLNKAPVSQTLDGVSIGAGVRSVTESDLKITDNRTFTLKATDERGATDTATSSITFLNGVYYGILEDGAAINSAAVLKLTRKLQGSKAITFTATAGATQRIAYAIPTRYGVPVFNVGGFEGGFSLAATFQFTNASSYTETYDVYLSDNVNLGSTTVKVS